MKNKEMKETIPNELEDNVLNSVSGGVLREGEPALITCPICGKNKREGYRCGWCELDNDTAICPKCQGKVILGLGCSKCSMSWDLYWKNTMWRRGM